MAKEVTTAPLGGPPAKVAEDPATPADFAGHLKWYKVKKGGDVSRGSSTYVLKPGKVINSGSYDIEQLLQQEIELVEIDQPRWHKQAQLKVAPPSLQPKPTSAPRRV